MQPYVIWHARSLMHDAELWYSRNVTSCVSIFAVSKVYKGRSKTSKAVLSNATSQSDMPGDWDPVYTETFSRVSVTFWLRLHLPFTRKRRKRFGKRMFSKTASKVELFENAAVLQPCKRTKRNVSETIRSRTRRWWPLSVKKEAGLPP